MVKCTKCKNIYGDLKTNSVTGLCVNCKNKKFKGVSYDAIRKSKSLEDFF
jgi:predicted  nucleic acid-binding Zn-ribbon protein